jgi:hypothetical protein
MTAAPPTGTSGDFTYAVKVQNTCGSPSEITVTGTIHVITEEEWDRTFGGTSSDFAYSVQQTTDSGYVLVGHTDSFGAGSNDAWLVKTDANGMMQWNRTFGRPKSDTAWAVRQTAEGGYVLAGYTNSFGAGGYDFWLVKTDANGNELWNRTFGGPSGDFAHSVQQTVDGGYILSGDTNSFGAGSYDFWLVKTDANGMMQWNRTFGGTSIEGTYSVQQTTDGGYILSGDTNSFGAGSYDFWLVKTDANGMMQWNRTFGGTSDEEAYSAQQTTDGGYILAGHTDSFGAGSYDAWLVKVKAELICGDANGDGKVDFLGDVIGVARHYMYGDPINCAWCADVDCDGDIDFLGDAIKIARHYMYGEALTCCP